MGKPEGTIENYMRRQAEAYDCLFYKFTSPSRAGVPDRILIGHGRVVFVEMKAPGEKPRPLQVKVFGDLMEHGAEVYVVDTKAGADALLESLFPGKKQEKKRGGKAKAAGLLLTVMEVPDD